MLPFALVFLVLFGFAASALLGFWWAAAHGQFSAIERGATSIFDEDEPIGQPTDSFPEARS
jgi:nitrogen fixation-related uncharacterized protein